MMRTKFLSLSLSALSLGLLLAPNGLNHIKSVNAADNIEHQQTNSRPSQRDFGEGDLIAQFGLGDIINIEDTIDNKIDRFESSIRSRVPNILQPLLPEDLFSLENERIFEFSNYLQRF